MAAMTKFNSFVTEMAAGTHVQALQASGTDVLKVFLTNDTPTAGTYQTFAGDGVGSSGTALGSISHANIVEVWPLEVDDSASTTVSGGTITVKSVNNAVATCDAGVTVPEFQYVVLYNDTQGDKLIGYWDNGSKVNLTAGQVFTCNFDTDTLFTVS